MQQTVEMSVMWYAMTFMWCHCNDFAASFINSKLTRRYRWIHDIKDNLSQILKKNERVCVFPLLLARDIFEQTVKQSVRDSISKGH